MSSDQSPKRMDRRAALKWMLAASASIAFLDTKSFGQAGPAQPTPGGYGFDPNLMSAEIPWDLTFTTAQRRTATALCDAILPRDGQSPSASELNVPDFIDEWISAPYPTQQSDRQTVLEGLAWMDKEANTRFKKRFDQLSDSQQTAICDDICYLPDAKSKYRDGARFFAKFRNLTTGGYYTTDIGIKEVGYVGNVPLPKFDGPPPEILKRLGVDKAPW